MFKLLLTLQLYINLCKCMIFYILILINKLSTIYNTLELRTYFHSPTSDASKSPRSQTPPQFPNQQRRIQTTRQQIEEKEIFVPNFAPIISMILLSTQKYHIQRDRNITPSL